MSPLLISLSISFIISLVSLVGLAFTFRRFSQVQHLTPFLVSLAVGTLLGDAFIHLLPQASLSLPQSASYLTLSGIIIFFLIEKFFLWRHCHQPDCHHNNSHLAALNLFGDLVHNFVDGLLIAASFQSNLYLGWTTAIAIFVHEIPQEISDFGVLLHSGLSPSRALKLNFFVSLSSILGTLLFFIIGSSITNLSSFLLPVTAGGFIYLASSDLIPELHRHDPQFSHTLKQLAFILLGIISMYLLKSLD